MKIQELHIAEAKFSGKMGMLMDAHRELGITHKWGPKHRLTDELVDNAVKMMKSAVGAADMGQLSSPAYPLNKVADGFKKLGGPALFDIHSGLTQLAALEGFMDAAGLKKLRDAATTIASQQHGMAEYCGALLSIMQAILEINLISMRSQDAYRKSIAGAVIKKLGLREVEATNEAN